MDGAMRVGKGEEGEEDRKNRGRGEDEEEEDEDSRDEGARTSAHANRTHAESHRIRAFLGKMSRFMLVKMAPDRSAGGLGSRNSRKGRPRGRAAKSLLWNERGRSRRRRRKREEKGNKGAGRGSGKREKERNGKRKERKKKKKKKIRLS